MAGRGIIGARQTNSAHLHRPWRAILRQSTWPQQDLREGSLARCCRSVQESDSRRVAVGVVARCCGWRTRDRTWRYRRELPLCDIAFTEPHVGELGISAR